MHHSTSRTGFTLLEVILVMVILVMLAAFAWPMFDSVMAYTKSVAAADSIKGALAQARGRAIGDAMPYRVAVIPGTNRFRVAPEHAEFWSGSPSDAKGAGNNPPLILEDTLPQGVAFDVGGSGPSAPSSGNNGGDSGSINPADWKTFAVFLPDGTARDDMEMTLKIEGAGPITVRLRSLTGTVRTFTGKEDN